MCSVRVNHSIYTGGDKQIRTADPLLARQVLSQLSYTPNLLEVFSCLFFFPFKTYSVRIVSILFSHFFCLGTQFAVPSKLNNAKRFDTLY